MKNEFYLEIGKNKSYIAFNAANEEIPRIESKFKSRGIITTKSEVRESIRRAANGCRYTHYARVTLKGINADFSNILNVQIEGVDKVHSQRKFEDLMKEFSETLPNLKNELRDKSLECALLQCSSKIKKHYPETPEDKHLLRPDVIAFLIREKPTNKNEFHNAIPEYVRSVLSCKESKDYIDEIFKLIKNTNLSHRELHWLYNSRVYFIQKVDYEKRK